MPAVYHGDHTYHLRHRLARIAITGVAGLLLAGMAALVTLVLDAQGAPTRWLWYLVVVSSLAWLVTAALGWWWYRRHRAELDAEGAEAEGELRARMHRRRDDRPR